METEKEGEVSHPGGGQDSLLRLTLERFSCRVVSKAIWIFFDHLEHLKERRVFKNVTRVILKHLSPKYISFAI